MSNKYVWLSGGAVVGYMLAGYAMRKGWFNGLGSSQRLRYD